MRFLLLFAAIIAAITGYYAYWTYLADELILQTKSWIEQRQQEGFEISHEGFEVRGFPYRLTLTIGTPAIARPGDKIAWHWRGDYMAIYFQPWNLSHLIAVVEGKQSFTWNRQGQTENIAIEGESVRISARLDGTGRPARIITEGHGLDILLTNGAKARVTDLQTALRINRGADQDRPDGSLDLAIRVDGLTLPAQYKFFLGETLTLFKAEGLLASPLPTGGSAKQLATWRDNGGQLEIRDLVLQWGSLDATAKGIIRLDGSMRPDGRLITALRGYGNALRAFAGNGGLTDGQATAAIFALNIMARDGQDGQRVVDTELIARDGKLSLGPVFLLNLPVLP